MPACEQHADRGAVEATSAALRIGAMYAHIMEHRRDYPDTGEYAKRGLPRRTGQCERERGDDEGDE